MARSVARIETQRASIYLQQLCKHFAHRRPVEFTPEHGQITLGSGICRLDAADGVLTIGAEAEDGEKLNKLQEVIEEHLLRFAFRDPPTMRWQSLDA
jgi:uncharacterized protein